MNVGESTVLEKVCRRTAGARHITLIDPAKQSAEVAAERAMVAAECGSSMIFVGGSTDTPDDVVHATCTAIQEALSCVCLPQVKTRPVRNRCGIYRWFCSRVAPMPVSGRDAITFMMLMNSTKRAFLVGEQVRGAPYLDRFGVEALPTGYVVCAPGGRW